VPDARDYAGTTLGCRPATSYEPPCAGKMYEEAYAKLGMASDSDDEDDSEETRQRRETKRRAKSKAKSMFGGVFGGGTAERAAPSPAQPSPPPPRRLSPVSPGSHRKQRDEGAPPPSGPPGCLRDGRGRHGRHG
jgi:hypothetical protein